MSGRWMEAHAREVLGMGDDWSAYKWEAVPPGAATDVYRITGACAPLYTRGPRKGRPNYDRAPPETKRTAYLRPAEHEAWVLARCEREDKCLGCLGEGTTLVSIHFKNGETRAECAKCEGSGKFQRMDAAAEGE